MFNPCKCGNLRAGITPRGIAARQEDSYVHLAYGDTGVKNRDRPGPYSAENRASGFSGSPPPPEKKPTEVEKYADFPLHLPAESADYPKATTAGDRNGCVN
jgi:hypothetical protein